MVLKLLASGGQQTLSQYAKTAPRSPDIKSAVFYLLDWDAELRESVFSFEQESLWKLTHRVSAMLGRGVNPASVDRRVREYKTGR